MSFNSAPIVGNLGRDAEMRYTAQPSADGFGMHGSGMFIINPPWTLHKTLEVIMPYLVRVLGQDAGAGFMLSKQGD